VLWRLLDDEDASVLCATVRTVVLDAELSGGESCTLSKVLDVDCKLVMRSETWLSVDDVVVYCPLVDDDDGNVRSKEDDVDTAAVEDTGIVEPRTLDMELPLSELLRTLEFDSKAVV
jgi:hypothetical protein